mmetsp:Transcript_44855/g.85749  ORF Transcript_44855/g.85749 Transcript_44855/m.85749 type:complete len:147 (+) Transcript_44855:1666-2106(+)
MPLIIMVCKDRSENRSVRNIGSAGNTLFAHHMQTKKDPLGAAENMNRACSPGLLMARECLPSSHRTHQPGDLSALKQPGALVLHPGPRVRRRRVSGGGTSWAGRARHPLRAHLFWLVSSSSWESKVAEEPSTALARISLMRADLRL